MIENLIKANSSSDVIFFMNERKVVFRDNNVTTITAVAIDSLYKWPETITPRINVAIKARFVVLPVMECFCTMDKWLMAKNKIMVAKLTMTSQEV